MHPRSNLHHRHAGGFTLPEVMMASAVLLFVVAALAQGVFTGQMHAYEAVRDVRASSLAEALIEEILAKPYSDPDGASVEGPEGDELDRDDFDNMDDYDDFEEAVDTLADAAGTLYADAYQRFTREATATYSTQTILGVDIDGLLVTVTVTDERGLTWIITRFIPEETA